jgi:hypothetical protein
MKLSCLEHGIDMGAAMAKTRFHYRRSSAGLSTGATVKIHASMRKPGGDAPVGGYQHAYPQSYPQALWIAAQSFAPWFLLCRLILVHCCAHSYGSFVRGNPAKSGSRARKRVNR